LRKALAVKLAARACWYFVRDDHEKKTAETIAVMPPA
jgi:hypothetical protein